MCTVSRARGSDGDGSSIFRPPTLECITRDRNKTAIHLPSHWTILSPACEVDPQHQHVTPHTPPHQEHGVFYKVWDQLHMSGWKRLRGREREWIQVQLQWCKVSSVKYKWSSSLAPKSLLWTYMSTTLGAPGTALIPPLMWPLASPTRHKDCVSSKTWISFFFFYY